MSQLSQLTGRVGPLFGGDGTTPVARLDKQAGLVVQQARGKYAEAVQRGNCYGGMTAVTGVSVASLSQGTTTPFTLANPNGSGKRLCLMNLTMGYVSGTFGAGNLTLSCNGISGTAVTGTAITAANLDIGGPAANVAKLFTTATVPAAPVPLFNLCNLDAFVGTVTGSPWNVFWDVDGLVWVEPGASISISGTTGAGTSPLVVFGCAWEEFPLG